MHVSRTSPNACHPDAVSPTRGLTPAAGGSPYGVLWNVPLESAWPTSAVSVRSDPPATAQEVGVDVESAPTTCSSLRKDGQPCKGRPVSDGLCLSHKV